MKFIFFFIAACFITTGFAQTLPFPSTGLLQPKPLFVANKDNYDSLRTPKWLITGYSGVSAAVLSSRGTSPFFFSVPAGIQINRRITNNWYGFANLSVANAYHSTPGYFSPYHFRHQTPVYPGSLGVYPAASLGVMYINDARTFSVSGRVTSEKYHPITLPYYQSTHTAPVYLRPR